ncbi:MAG: hypothetical protein OEV28_01010 [Nitrospirota bacterium]|nr:hypothetical protein [Nitrospirota bacterium]
MKKILLMLLFAVVSTTAWASQPDPAEFQQWDCKYRFVDIDQDDNPDVIQVHYYSPEENNSSDVDAYYLIDTRELVKVVWTDNDGSEQTWSKGFTVPEHAATAAASEEVVERSF